MGGARLWTELLSGKRLPRDQVLCRADAAAAALAAAALAVAAASQPLAAVPIAAIAVAVAATAAGARHVLRTHVHEMQRGDQSARVPQGLEQG